MDETNICSKASDPVIEGRAQALVTLRAPEGLSLAYTLSGERLTIPDDRLVQVVESDAPGLLGAGFTRIE
ncbi:hypothetical protein K9U39_11340 [Rhodoblastus acidophilus]|uniref:Uncharacterized protein n=1 Tax=Candidatus Rhodoblastus alkanivorans TaxID=2954117 RepID=A0ABS9Z9F1_9HYPH|nr:hypothetical protein [Candidatus Rhodoblastus alkanivorans]MCI4678870.1 hypothetical protein [Candidatus Rhodoblastus alkanivorans]MCI4684206.1 hypothetical protein [Candidatus Rhodoblastus alkanivorans]MDI4641527.1 hypothetical protein [Rhodoblastus acidophilus]